MISLNPAQRLAKSTAVQRLMQWAAAQPILPLFETGCVQCGSRLERAGRHNHSGKCFNCAEWVADDGEDFAEFE